jgi:hypothetical protein
MPPAQSAITSSNTANSNDDHPPCDLAHGQRLVARVVNALLAAPDLFAKTLLIIAYDEHGGFYDHVPPPPPPAAAEPATDSFFSRDGVRVPAIAVSPWVAKAAVSHAVFDHTSIVKTILTRFCSDATGTIPAMGRRDAAALPFSGGATPVATAVLGGFDLQPTEKGMHTRGFGFRILNVQVTANAISFDPDSTAPLLRRSGSGSMASKCVIAVRRVHATSGTASC